MINAPLARVWSFVQHFDNHAMILLFLLKLNLFADNNCQVVVNNVSYGIGNRACGGLLFKLTKYCLKLAKLVLSILLLLSAVHQLHFQLSFYISGNMARKYEYYWEINYRHVRLC